jgi:hypothetical protein
MEYLADWITSIENGHVLKKWVGQCSSRVPVRLEELNILSSFRRDAVRNCAGILEQPMGASNSSNRVGIGLSFWLWCASTSVADP